MDSRLTGLLANVANAFALSPPRYVRSLLGDPAERATEDAVDQEFAVLDHGLGARLSTLRAIALPSMSGRPAWWPKAAPSFGIFRQSKVLPWPQVSKPDQRFARESWLLLNGICTDERVLDINAECLHRLFGRPLTLLHNQTNGALIDLAECALGKGWLAATEAVRALFPSFYAELKRTDCDRVVLIAHSQGTILAAIFVALLRELHGKGETEGRSRESRQAKDLLAGDRGGARRMRRVMLGARGAAPGRIDPWAHDDDLLRWFDWSPDALLGLPALSEAELRKLEIYSFATCATEMRAIIDGERPAPYIEHFGNDHDLVARLGLFAPAEGPGLTNIEGLRFERENAWGHLLDSHYLLPLEQQWRGALAPGFALTRGEGRGESRLARAFREARAFEASAGAVASPGGLSPAVP